MVYVIYDITGKIFDCSISTTIKNVDNDVKIIALDGLIPILLGIQSNRDFTIYSRNCDSQYSKELIDHIVSKKPDILICYDEFINKYIKAPLMIIPGYMSYTLYVGKGAKEFTFEADMCCHCEKCCDCKCECEDCDIDSILLCRRRCKNPKTHVCGDETSLDDKCDAKIQKLLTKRLSYEVTKIVNFYISRNELKKKYRFNLTIALMIAVLVLYFSFKIIN